jgi:hypothetical protein
MSQVCRVTLSNSPAFWEMRSTLSVSRIFPALNNWSLIVAERGNVSQSDETLPRSAPDASDREGRKV